MTIKQRVIYVMGHIRPDTDSICAALAYADLKRKLGYLQIQPVRAGVINPQTRFILHYFGFEEPKLITDLHVRVEDVLEGKPILVSPSTPLQVIGELVRTQKVKTFAVVDHRERLLGLVTVGDLAEKYLEELAEKDTTQVASKIQQILCTPVSSIMRSEGLVFFLADDLLKDARRQMLETRYRNYPVVDEEHRVLGFISRYHLLAFSRKQVILVDHNEKSQAVDGIEEAEILEIIDHHRLGDLQSGEPIYIRNEPVGSTCTLITRLFLEHQITPDPRVAGLLCAGILSDTVLFKSPTTTEQDRQMVQILAPKAGIDPEVLGRDMFRASVSQEGRSPEDLFYEDFKEFILGEEKVGVSQIEVMELEVLQPLREALKAVMEKARAQGGYDLVILMLTDLLREGTELWVKGKNPARIGQAFRDYAGVDVEVGREREGRRVAGDEGEGHCIYLPGVISRKKQVVPVLVKFLGQQKG
ncbi:MAG: putative manganese-dependent inorganic diphosphatase [Syntrophomonadaceae bacterium]|nr:putative manganese-dependent inorganic diphosphatase [Syntrophomonadaceae bacterium]